MLMMNYKHKKGNKTLKVTGLFTVGEIASLMDVPITKVIGTVCPWSIICLTMNQRLDAETLSIVADEFGYEVNLLQQILKKQQVSSR